MFFRCASNHRLNLLEQQPESGFGKWFGPKAELTFHPLRYNMDNRIGADGVAKHQCLGGYTGGHRYPGPKHSSPKP
jgi:hypothetical protein